MKYIIVHGIGDSQEGWAKDLYQSLGCRPEDIIEFNWEDNIERTWWDRLTRWTMYKTPVSRALLDYGADVPRYFFDKRLRWSITDELVMTMYMLNEPFMLIGFSLGSVVALEAIAAMDDGDLNFCTGLLTIGSPIDQPVIRRLIRHPKVLRQEWVNYWSAKDLVSARIMVQYNQVKNFAVEVGHDINAYLEQARLFLSTRGQS